MLNVGTVLKNSYKIEGYLASGGFGKTYVAKIIEFDELVAIKEFFISGVTERENHSNTISVSNTNQPFFEQQLNKFKKEARRLRKLKHDNIVRVHDLFEENGTAYYVMDYIEGESLSQQMKRTGMPIDEKDAMNYFLQILDALETVHHMSIWHLDLKPGNIMLDKYGNVKLIDFGASKQQNKEGNGATTSTAVAFTNGYAPPEQMEENLSKFGPWTDIYALGATLYKMLTTYNPPLPSDLDDDPTSDKSRALPMPYVSVNTKKLILWMMTTNRQKRPQSVADVRRFMSGGSLRKQPNHVKKTSNLIDSQQQDNVTRIDSQSKKWPVGKILTISGVAALLLILALLYFNGAIGGNTVDNVDLAIEQLGTCKYTGQVNDEGLPHGKGKAVFSDGRIYEGPFVNGKCEGEKVVLTYENGDTFEGTFQDNDLKEGKFTNHQSGYYFKGTFRDGVPDEGKWFDKNDNEQQ